MIRFTLALPLLLFLSCAAEVSYEPSDTSAFVRSIPKLAAGDVARVDEWRWVNVVNLDTVGGYSWGDLCGICEGGRLVVIAPTNPTGCCSVLVRYEAPFSVYGTNCPSAIIFFVDNIDFWDMTENYKGIVASREDKRNYVRSLLEEK